MIYYILTHLYIIKNKLIGSVGSITKVYKILGLNKAFLYLEIKVESLPRNDLEIVAPSIYPISQRDFSFEIDNKVST